MHSRYAAINVETRGKTTSLSFVGVTERASERVKERKKGEKKQPPRSRDRTPREGAVFIINARYP